MSDKEKMYELIKSGSEEGKEAFDNLYRGLLQGAAVSIINRNFSHGIGSNIKKYKI